MSYSLARLGGRLLIATSLVAAAVFGLTTASAHAAVSADGAPTQTIVNGSLNRQAVLYDTSGNKVDAHDGKIYFFAGTYYLYGDSYSCGFAINQPPSNYCGVKVYDSSDLVHWHADGLALDPTVDQTTWNAMCGGSTFGCFRPKVAYNASTDLYVMWLNESLGTPGAGYLVLTSPTPAGPFTLQNHVRMTYDRCQQPGNFAFGDEDLFVDDDGTAYLAYTAISVNCTPTPGLADHNIAVELLDPTYTKPSGHYMVFNRPYGIEAPSLFKRDGLYYLIFSDPMCAYCTTAGTAYATSTGPGQPFIYRGNITPSQLGGQPGAVTPIAANGTVQYLFQLDRWQPNAYGGYTGNQYEANYFLAPLSFAADGSLLPIPPVVSWQTRVQDEAPDPTSSAALASVSTSVGLHALAAPVRVIDTRSGLGGVTGRLQPSHGTYTFRISGLPAGASTLLVNVTAISAAGAGNVTVWGPGPRPATSVVNYSKARSTAPNLATVNVAAGSSLSAAVEGSSAFLAVDVQGYYSAGSALTTLSPARRIVDTRASNTPIAAGGTEDLDLRQAGVVPSTAKAVTVNLTVVSSRAGNLQAYDPAQATQGQTVRVVFGSGATANLSMLPMPADGILRFVNTAGAAIQVIVDVQAYESAATETLLPNPVRLESASAPQVGYYSAPFTSQLTYQFDARGAGVPDGATAVLVEIGASPATAGNVTTMADDSGVPTTSNINFSPGVFQSNLALIPLRDGHLDTYAVTTSDIDVSIDVVGYTQ